MSEDARQIDSARACFGKMRYGSEADALGVAAKRFAESSVLLRVYLCDAPDCGGWHLTSSNVPDLRPGWRPPAKSRRQIARERRSDQRRRKR